MTGSNGCKRNGRAAFAMRLWVLLTIALAGCATPPADLPADHPLIQANEYMAELATARRVAEKQAMAQSNKPLDRLDNKLFGDTPVKPVRPVAPRPKITEGEGFRKFIETYAYTGNAVQLNQWTEAFRRACARNGGNLVGGAFCAATGDPDRVLFMVNIRPGWGSSSVWFDITLVEPTAQPPSAAYRQQLYAAGFQDQAMQRASSQAATAAAAAKADAERARLAIDLPRMRVKGQMVCKTEDQLRFVGYVEDFTEDRLKISVAQATVGATGWSPTAFKPGVIWTSPEGWAPCARVKP
jgi:hypothetical protein